MKLMLCFALNFSLSTGRYISKRWKKIIIIYLYSFKKLFLVCLTMRNISLDFAFIVWGLTYEIDALFWNFHPSMRRYISKSWKKIIIIYLCCFKKLFQSAWCEKFLFKFEFEGILHFIVWGPTYEVDALLWKFPFSMRRYISKSSKKIIIIYLCYFKKLWIVFDN